jgi:predicted metal-dependent peptidase
VTTKPKVNPNEQAQRIERAVVKMVVDHPFFAALTLKLQIEQDASVPTFCTDGVRLIYNPEFAAKLDDREVFTVLGHEVAHLAFGHLWRKGSRNHQQWNMATDYVINNYLMQYNEDEETAGRMGPFKLPEGALLDPKYNGMAEEEVYVLLGDQPQPPPPPGEGSGDQGDGDGESSAQPPSSGSGQPSPDGQPSQQPGRGMGEFTEPADAPSNTQSDWQNRAVEGLNAAKLQGRGGGNLARIVEKYLRGVQDWREILRELMSSAAYDDYDEQRPDRRFLEDDIFLPTLYSERVGPFVVALDTSGSVDSETLAQFLGEVQFCLDTVKPEKITMVDCDDQIYQTTEFSPGENLTVFSPKGGGGTSFTPVFDHVKTMTDRPEAVVYFTDGMGTFPKDAPPYPVIWVDYGGSQYPFGEVVRVNAA